MTKLLPRLGGVAAAAALLLVVGAGPASANTTSYHKSDGTVLSITTPDNVSATYGSQTQFPVTVSVNGPSPVNILQEKLNTQNGPDIGDPGNGLFFAQMGCWGKTLTSNQSCTTQLKFVPTGIGTTQDWAAYMILTSLNGYAKPLRADLTATGVPCRRACLPVVVVPVGPPKP
jgi:hypothetical protein